MGIKMTESQMTKVKELVDVAGHFTDQLLYIMRNHGLDKVNGCHMTIEISPELKFVTERVTFGYPNSDAGNITVAKGVYDEKFRATGAANSAEYELLFADDAIKERLRAILRVGKPLPPDGLWVSDDRYSPPVDRGVQVDDGMAE